MLPSTVMNSIRIILAVAVALSTASLVRGADKLEIVTDRPDFVESALTVPRHHFQFETSAAVIDDDSGGVEPRQGGPVKLAFTMSENMDAATVTPANVQVNCAVGPNPVDVSSVTLEPDNRTVVVELPSAPADENCCVFTFEGMRTDTGGVVADSYNVKALQGDVSFDGFVSGTDPSIIKPHFGEILGVDLSAPQYDYDLNGAVTGGDFALIKPLLGHLAPTCP